MVGTGRTYGAISRTADQGTEMKHYPQNDQAVRHGVMSRSRRPPDERHRPEHLASDEPTHLAAARHNALTPAEVDEEIRQFFEMDAD